MARLFYARLLAYRRLDEVLGATVLACLASGCPQCAWKKSAADSASFLGLPMISPDIINAMTTSRIAPRKASSPPQSFSASGRERKAATIFEAPSESDLSEGVWGVGFAAAAGQAVANASERTAQTQLQTDVNRMIVDPSMPPAATQKNNGMNEGGFPELKEAADSQALFREMSCTLPRRAPFWGSARGGIRTRRSPSAQVRRAFLLSLTCDFRRRSGQLTHQGLRLSEIAAPVR